MILNPHWASIRVFRTHTSPGGRHSVTIKIRSLAFTPPPELVNEQQRLEELYAMKILDTAAEQRFDQYAQLAATILDVPIALISFVDKDRQWFKSAFGLDADETPRNISFCAHALVEDEILVVPDTQIDPRFLGNPLVEGEPGVRFYAGAVIRGPNGHPLGTCCAIDHKERKLSDPERAAMLQIARMVERELQITAEAIGETRELQSYGLLDATTGLPNMELFSAKLDKAIETAAETSRALLLAIVRVEKFDGLEAALGIKVAKYLVGQLARRIQTIASPEYLIGQDGNDKLCVLLPLASGQTSELILNELLSCIRDPIDLADHSVSIRVSIGGSQYPRHANSGEKLLKRAHTALWSTPMSEQSAYNLYKRRQSHDADRNFRLQSALKRGLELGEFHLVYQPKIDIRRQQLIGAEALLRWRSDRLGDVSPAEFIPAAEKSGLIIELGAWVLSDACLQMSRWRAAGNPCPEVAVNITSLQLRRPDFFDGVKKVLAQHDVKPGQLNLELTESSLVDDIESAVKIMHRLGELGVTFSIDDFGTGFSSLSYLRKMPIKVLKIDQSFVTNISDNVDDMKLVQSIISMGHTLDMVVVAEGVETEQQLSYLRSVGCDQVQGYVFSRPLSPEDFEQTLVTGLHHRLPLAERTSNGRATRLSS